MKNELRIYDQIIEFQENDPQKVCILNHHILYL